MCGSLLIFRFDICNEMHLFIQKNETGSIDIRNLEQSYSAQLIGQLRRNWSRTSQGSFSPMRFGALIHTMF